MSEAERVHATRVHKLNCWQHMRNIFLNNMSKAQAKHVSEELKPWLDAFTSWERMTTDFDQLLRSVYKVSCEELEAYCEWCCEGLDLLL